MSSFQPLADLLAALQRAFSALGLRWFLFGAQAAIFYGAARLTADVDVTVELGERSIDELIATLESAGFDARVPDTAAFVERTKVLPVVHRATRIPVDCVLAGPGLEQAFLSRARDVPLGDVRIPIVSAEDLVAMKILAGRPKDLDDVATVLTAGKDLDVDLVRTTLRMLERGLDRNDLVTELDRIVSRVGRA